MARESSTEGGPPYARQGELSALPGREGLCSSHLSRWREARRRGELAGLTPRRPHHGCNPGQALDVLRCVHAHHSPLLLSMIGLGDVCRCRASRNPQTSVYVRLSPTCAGASAGLSTVHECPSPENGLIQSAPPST